jgi:hypothetical protein
MRNNSRIFVLVMCCLLSFCHVRAMAQQTQGSATVSTQDQGPSLSVTTQFIQDKTLEWTHMTFSMARDGNQYFQGSVDYDKATLSPDRCTMSIVEHRKLGQLGIGAVDPEVSSFEHRIRLADITGVAIDYAADQSAAPWFDGYQRILPPAVTYLRIDSSNRGPAMPAFDLIFQNDALAERYAKGLIHAVSLCHGKELPFEDVATLTARRQQEDIVARQRRMDAIVAAQKEAQRQAALAQAAAAQAQAVAQAQNQEQNTQGDTQNRISELRSDIDEQERNAENNESSANQVLNNCSGPGAAICQALGQAGAARFRQKAAQARNQADSDREEIQRLEGQEVQASQRRDTSYGGSLQQVTTETGTSIQSAAAQQQANLQAMAAANQQRQQAQAQQPAPSKSPPAARSSSVTTPTAVPATTATPGPAASSSGNNPYNSASAQGSYNPYTGTGSGSIQGSCTDMTRSVQGTVKVGSDGWVIGYLTNNSTETLYVSYTFKQNGVPSTDMANAGGTSIQGGQTVGGEGQGLYSTGADKNQARIYWYAIRQVDHDKYGCVHNW